MLDLRNTYGKVQELNTRSRTDTANGLSNTLNASYQHDDEIRLTQAQTDSGGLFGNDTEAFTLDPLANRIAHSKATGAWVYNGNNQLLNRPSAAGPVSYSYDTSGNQIQKTEGSTVTGYTYDSSNRLVEIKDGQGNPMARYGYDPLSRRIWKEQYRDKAGQVLAQAQRIYYLYNDESLIAEATQDIAVAGNGTVSANAPPVITAQYGPRPGNPFTTGVLFVKARNSAGADSLAYYHHDHLNTPLQATDKLGNIVWAANYNAFGRATLITPAATADKPTITSNLRLPEQYEDQESGLRYNWHRFYDADTGRYTQSDPIGLDGGLSTFSYVSGNPLGYTDPEGLAGAIPKNYGKDKPINSLPNPTKNVKEKNDQNANLPTSVNGIRCAFGLGGCPTDDPALYVCLVKRCTPKSSGGAVCEPYIVDYRDRKQHLEDPETPCVCLLNGFNPNYRGGPPPGL